MLEVHAISVGYGGRPALHDVSVAVAAGRLTTLIGANGAGKSTLLRTISGLLRPRSGEIVFEGVRISGLSAARIAKLGISHVPEGRQLFGNMSVYENLELGALNNRTAFKSSLAWMLDLFPVLGDRQSQSAGTLSGGEQQMLAIARGLMADPRLLLLDEPSLGLSPLMVDKLAEVIQKLRGAGLTILLVEQNARLALELADFGYVLETGSVVVGDSADRLAASDLVRQAYLGG